MTFYDRPFVFITLPFLVGLVLAFACRTHAILLAYCSCILLFLALILFVFRARGMVFLCLSCLSFCGIGSLLMLERLHVFEGNPLEQSYKPGDIYVLRICESRKAKEIGIKPLVKSSNMKKNR